MRVVFLAAGAAGMYCGSCMRDNRLAASLIAQGKDVILIPLYTPLRTDETDVSQRKIYYGGLNVYLEQRSALFRRLPNWLTQLFDSPVLLQQISRFAGRTRPQDLGPLTVSVLKGEQGAQQKELDRLIDGLKQVQPDLINLPNLMFVGVAEQLKKILNVPVVCTLSGEDIFLDSLIEPHRQEAFELIREQSKHIDGFVAVTEYFATHAAKHFSIPADRINVIPMGINVQDFPEAAPPKNAPFTIGYLARVCPEKGLAQLCRSLVQLRKQGRNCQVLAAGYIASADRPYLQQIQTDLEQEGMSDAFEYMGEVSRAEKIEMLRSIHAFSVPTLYHEAKGFYLLEALACGVPVVQPHHGSFPELIRATDGGLLYDQHQPDGLTDSLARLMEDEELRLRLGSQGRKIVHNTYTNENMAKQSWSLFQQYAK